MYVLTWDQVCGFWSVIENENLVFEGTYKEVEDWLDFQEQKY